MPEQPKQNPQNTPSDTKLALSPEQDKQLQKEREQVLMLSKMQRGSLSSESLSMYLQKYHDIDLSKYSPEIKQKFLEEIQMLFSEFKDFDESMITRLKAIREWMSFWLETGKSNEYYRNLIIWNAIETRVKVLQETINTQYWETMEFKWTKVNKADFTDFETNTKNLDKQNGLNIFESVLSKLRPSIQGWLNFSTLNLQDIIQQECKKNNKPYSQELFQTYNTTYQEFVWKNIVFNARNGNGVIQYKWKWFWLTSGWVNGLTNDRLKDIYKDKFEELNLENMWIADLIIMLRVLFWVIPFAWDMVWWYDDVKQALAWVNFDGSMHGLWENTFMYLISWLQLTIVWWWFAKLAKWPKLAKAMMTIWKIIEKLSRSPEILKNLAKNEKFMQMLETMKRIVPKVEELLENIKAWIKNPKQTIQDAFPNTEKVLKWNEKKRIPKKRPEEVIEEKNIIKKFLEEKIPGFVFNIFDQLKKVEWGDDKLNEIQMKLMKLKGQKLGLFQEIKIIRWIIEEANTFLKWAKKETKIKYIEDNFADILWYPEKFNSQEWLKYVRKLTGEKRVEAMKIWKQKLKEQLYIISQIPTQVKEISEWLNFSKLSKEEIMQSIVRKIKLQFEKLSIEQRKEVLSWIEKFVDRKIIVHRYAENPLYKENPKRLITEAFWIDISKLKWEVTMEIDAANFTFYIHNKDDYKLLEAFWNEKSVKNNLSSWWLASPVSWINELKWTITLVNWSNDWNLYRKWTKIHESRHADNKLIMPDYWNRDNLTRAKDEIIAYLTDGSNIDRIATILHKKWDDALYDYYKNIEKENPKRYKALRKLYEQELQSAISIAEKMQKANIPNYLDILAITPVRQWSHLESIFGNLLKYTPENFHIKMRDKRTIPYIFGEEYTDFSREYEVLEQMYKIAPQYVVKPLEYNNAIWYYVTEKSKWASLQKFYDSYMKSPKTYKNDNIDTFFTQLEEVIKNFHSNGVVHWDLLWNLLVYRDMGSLKLKFKIIDPVWVTRWGPNYELFVQKDIDDIKNIREKMLWTVSTPVNPKFTTTIKPNSSDVAFDTPVNPKFSNPS